MSNKFGYNGGRIYSSLIKPTIVDLNFIVDSTNANGLGIRSLSGSLVRDVFMYTTQTAGVGNGGVTNPMAQSASKGYAWIQLKDNFTKYLGHFGDINSPVTGSNVAINGSALTVGVPYEITAVGHSTLGAVTIAPVADSAGSLASTWFRLFDNYGNTFVIWFSVAGVGSAPSGLSGVTLVQQSIASGATAASIGASLVTTIAALPSGISGVFSFTAAGTTTVTVTSTQTNPYSPLPGAPSDGTVATGFTFARTVTKTNQNNWNNVGLPKGVLPVAGATFMATATGDSSSGGSTGTVKAIGVSATTSMEVVGFPNYTIAPIPIGGSGNKGGWVMVQFLAPTISAGAYIAPMIPTAPTDNSLVNMSLYLETSAVTISGL